MVFPSEDLARRGERRSTDGRARVGLLGGFELTWNGGFVPLPQSSQRFMAYLALQDRPRSRAHVAGALWPEATDQHANANLRSVLWRAHQPLDGLVEVGARHLFLASDVAVDVRELLALARLLLDSGGRGELKDTDLRLLTADVLPDWSEEWVVSERERVRQLRLHALEALCARFTQAGRIGDAVEAGLAAVEADPFRESAHRVLMLAHLAEGNRAQVMDQYRSYRQLLRQELGVGPSPELEELIRPLSVP